MPLLGRVVGVLLNSRLDCRIRSPLLMPFPHGIVIERGVSLGSRVTVMHQVTIGRKDPVVPREHGGNLAVIEDNVFIGAGAKVLGPVRIGRSATVGANAVVTRDVADWLAMDSASRETDFLLLDPPRTGAESRVIFGILKLKPQKICYVSCDPATLARDLKKLIAGGYSIDSIKAFDMFPQTHHVETVVHLSS